jgi:membrane-bound lytic murein transglycosylase D
MAAPSLLAQNDDLFPRPPELQPAVDFWIRVYTEVDTQSGFLHDAENLAVVYRALPRDRREIERRRTLIQEDLRVLASGKREGLTLAQQQILDMWGEGVSNERLRRAARNVRWQLGQSDRFLGGLRRSGAYRNHINQVIREKNLPLELGVLPHVESSFNPGAYSSASAAGMWQFGRATGQRFMRIDHIVDERMDPYIATGAAMSLLEYNYRVLGTWPLALTAYNHGAGGIARAVRETGTTDIETIVANYKGRAFGFASRNFYAQFLAVLDVERDAQEYFGRVAYDPAPYFREVELDSFIDAQVFADSVGVSLEQLRQDNPALRPAVWQGSKRIPRGFTVKLRADQVSGDNLLASIRNDYKFAVQTPDVAYTVARGDSLSVIARRFNTSVATLASLNNLASRHRIQIGQRLLLPQQGDGNQLAFGSASELDGGRYTVRRGDTISTIARRFSVAELDLLARNGIDDRNLIYPGQDLAIPGLAPDSVQLAAIDANLSPAPPTQRVYSDGRSLDAAADSAAANQPSVNPEGLAAAPARAAGTVILERTEGPYTEAPSAVAAAESQAETPSLAASAVSSAIEEELAEPDAEESTLAGGADIQLPSAPSDSQGLESNLQETVESAVALEPGEVSPQNDDELTEALSADPSDYSVADNSSIEIQAEETLGHYADWLGIRAWDIRRLNGMAYRDPVIIGDRLQLRFGDVSIEEFERLRRDYHSSLQQEFFQTYRIQSVETYRVKRGDNIGRIASSRYSTPIWLLRQYNPELDFNRIQIDQEIVFPLLEPVQ